MELKSIAGLKEEEISSLTKHWITTAEEFISISSNPSLSDNLRELLNVNIIRYNEIVRIVSASLPNSKVAKIKSFKNPQFKTGTRKPKK